MKAIRIITLAAIVLPALNASAQDFHISQYDGSPLYLNPALTGMYMGEPTDHRVNSGYRTQWNSIGSKPFVSTWLGYDTRLPGKFGAGAFLMNNRSGTGHFNHLSFVASGAYHISEMNAPHHLTVGLQLGVFQKRVDPARFTFDSQYSETSGFDNAIASGEIFERNSKTNFDANMGIYYRYYQESARLSPFIGLATFHVPRPNESFVSTQNRLPIRWVLHGGSEIKAGEKFRLIPMFLFMQQSRAIEINPGFKTWYEIDEQYSIMAGVDYRIKDALIAHLGMSFRNHVFRLSYDFNTSYLNEYSNGFGGVEFSLLLNLTKNTSVARSTPKI